MPAALLVQLVASSVKIATHAGKIIKQVLSSGDLKIVDKTEADRLSQNCIISSLYRLFPKLIIIGEEELGEGEIVDVDLSDPCLSSVLAAPCPQEFKDVAEEQIVVWVDPFRWHIGFHQRQVFCLLCAHRMCSGHLDNATVLIGMAVGGKPVAGVIHQPWNKERTIWGLVGFGVGNLVPKPAVPDQLIVATSRSHSNQNNQLCMQALRPDQVLYVGGSGYKVLLLLEGVVHAYVFASPGCKKWDTCASEAILTAAGGVLTSLHGKQYSYSQDSPLVNSGGILATMDIGLHSQLLARIPDTVQEALQ